MTRRTDQGHESVERILVAATLLFAERGYHGVSTREIAQAAGLNIATVNYHLGSKLELYRAVFERIYHQERAVVAAFVNDIEPEVLRSPALLRDLFIQLIDALVAMTLEHPTTPRLWIWRWLEQQGPQDGIDADFSLPLFQMVNSLLQQAIAFGTIRSDVDIPLFLKSFGWLIYSYMMSGPLDWQTARANPLDAQQIAEFKAFLHRYMCRMLDLNE
jgi:AcrR family transcriptional regulator